ncbi:unnamed protein product [Effrenium voratum]|uniref:Uncharacterized protein n=1 Tax=Effrenium voratum TaxID=2562239 RepID=A0AA36N3H9_9DINO|nr:unnamed protein product [Effrenium voratum]
MPWSYASWSDSWGEPWSGSWSQPGQRSSWGSWPGREPWAWDSKAYPAEPLQRPGSWWAGAWPERESGDWSWSSSKAAQAQAVPRPEQESNGDQAWNSSQETAQPVSMPRPTDLADASAVTVADVSQTAVTLTELQEEIRSWLLGIDCTLLSYFDIIEENYDTVDQICRLYLVEDGGQRRLDPLFFEDNQVTDAEHQRLFRQWFAGKAGQGAHLPDPNPCQEPEAAGPAEAPALTGTAGLDSRGDDPWFAGKDPWAKPGVAPLNGGEGPKDGPRSPPLPKEEPLPGAGQDPSHPAVTNGAGNGSPAPVTTGPHVSSEAWRSWWSSPDGGWSSSWSSWDGSWR